ncbi:MULTISPECIES: penicillin-binding transpeptidase domain-containing protein [Streptomyces]|jgi:peptidoglycan glycosyltransferase|uniref:Secreted penicillin-binding protein n=3 Tax=Streptomyces griseoaurantiacus TaxID=68213 RepID=F3NN33_9ACTN|nr:MULTISPECIES: penicillin-binding transpeptidase domain-containing protein [Streptomyces]EGG45219.1 secreted penicillin-binding protein [Streptomyces griseoaurantiacus M045]MBA5221179.1 penicillin-binding protein 2 [Streptomyces griseoaurantiacus]MCF0085398.1 Penicillin-binding protein A [Streptomyces sp. MH192]MCF0097833.1 Penicillin-binding protein A [Streptomyces sp. MH191]MDX3089137.1 penicillin-binding transpeptidase domain-containing protein [Streptomyces sp. ME12-02E]
MTRYIRRAALLCALLLVALLVNVVRVQLVRSETYSGNPANRRTDIARWGQPRGDILVGGRPVTGSRDTGGLFRYARTYTDGPLYAPVTGFASQVYGSTLLEHARDGLLAGTDPGLAALPLLSGLTRARGTGGTVVTTIDPEAQRAAHEGLAGRHGAVAALDPVTGRILALVSAPSYDPGELSGTGAASARAWRRLDGDPDRPMLNRAVGQTYPPGSTFKVVTAAAALDAGVAGDLDAPTDSPDPYTLPGTRTRLTNEVEGCTDASLRYAFAWSCNTVFARLGVETGWKAMSRTAAAFGFDAPGPRVPFAVARSTFAASGASAAKRDRAQLALSSIGQFDTRATPLQMAMVASAVAGDGSVPVPYLVERTTTAAGTTLSAARPRTLHRAMRRETAERLRELMTGVVEEGTGANAAIPGAVVGGKTGTAQHGVGNAGTPYAWFISWARAEDAPAPAVAVAVVVEDARAGRGEISGGGDAAPIARAVMEAVLGDRAARER